MLYVKVWRFPGGESDYIGEFAPKDVRDNIRLIGATYRDCILEVWRRDPEGWEKVSQRVAGDTVEHGQCY